MRTAVLDRLNVSSGDAGRVTQIDQVLNSEYQRLVARHSLSTVVASVATTASVATAPLPASIVRIVSLRTASGIVQAIPAEEYAQKLATGYAASTTAFYYWESSTTIRLLPVPTATSATALTITYVARPAVISGASIPSLLPDEYHQLLVEKCIMRTALSEEEIGLSREAGNIAMGLEQELSEWILTRDGRPNTRLRLRFYG